MSQYTVVQAFKHFDLFSWFVIQHVQWCMHGKGETSNYVMTKQTFIRPLFSHSQQNGILIAVAYDSIIMGVAIRQCTWCSVTACSCWRTSSVPVKDCDQILREKGYITFWSKDTQIRGSYTFKLKGHDLIWQIPNTKSLFMCRCFLAEDHLLLM
jgi:hypothetical protein